MFFFLSPPARFPLLLSSFARRASLLFSSFFLFFSSFAFSDPYSSSSNNARPVDVNALKKQYWLPSAGLDASVIQNRLFTKSWKINIQAVGGSFAGDPFVDTLLFGGSAGFHVGEYLGLHALYFKMMPTFNGAHSILLEATASASSNGASFGSNSNMMQSLMGGEASWNILYGKLSLLGKAILHFDLFLLAGGGMLNAQTGATQGVKEFSAFTYWPGIGQQIYLTRWMAFHFHYRLLVYTEKIIDRNTPDNMGNPPLLGKTQRFTTAPTVTVGLTFLFP